MKLYLLTFLAVISYGSLNAQDEIETSEGVNITKSAPYEVVDGYRKMYFPLNENSILGVKIQGKKRNVFVFQLFSGSNLDLVETNNETVLEKGFNFEFIRQMNGKLYLFYSIYQKSTKTYEFFARSINPNSGGFDSEGKLLVSVDKKLVGFSKFSIDVSSSEETFVVKYRYNPEIKDDSKSTDLIGMQVFESEDLNKVWGNDFVMPYTESMMDNLDFAIDSEGTGYFLVRKYGEVLTRKNRENSENQSLAILVSGSDGELHEMEFKLGDKIATSVYLQENNKGDVICTGYYRKPKSYGVDGIFVSILDNQGSLSDPLFYEFTLDFIKKYRQISERGKKQLEKAEEADKLSMSNLYLRDVRVLADGGILLSGEIFYITSYTDSRGNTHTTPHYDDVIVVKINADGSLGWMEKFYKRSISESFRVMASAKYAYILFVDAKRNASMTEEGVLTDKETKGFSVTAHRIDNSTGEIKYLHLFDTRKIDGIPVYQYNLNRVIGITDTSFAIELYIKGKQDMMFKVEIDE